MTNKPMETDKENQSAPEASRARPGVLQVSIKETAALYAAYMPFVDGGGLFVPTTRAAHMGDQLYLVMTLMDEPDKLPVTGTVIWITPPGTPGRQQGLGIQFARDAAGEAARTRIETLLGGALKSSRPTHTI
jgi:type IV pilus assembly protein PilZ